MAQKLDQLQKTMEEGFRLTHEKQNYTNGKVTQAGIDIIELQKVDIKLDEKFKYNKVIWYMFTIAVGIITGLAVYLITNQ